MMREDRIMLTRRMLLRLGGAMCCSAATDLGRAVPASAAGRIVISEYGVAAASLPWAVALDRGLLHQNGLDVDEILGSNGGGTTIRTMLASGIGFTETGLNTALAAYAAGTNLKLVYSGVNNTGDLEWLVRKDSPLRSIGDLKGRRVAITGPKSTTEMVLRMVLEKAGLGESVDLVSTGNSRAGLLALGAGAVDAAPINAAYALKTADRYRVLFRGTDVFPFLTWQVGIATTDFVASQSKMLRALVEARRKAVDVIYGQPSVAAAVYAKIWSTDDRTAATIIALLIHLKYWSPGNFNLTGLENMLRGIELVGALEKPVSLSAVIDKSFLPPDLKG